MNNNNHSGCFSPEDLLSYLYDELKETEGRRLDVHLAGCRSCTDDFASLSESHLSVYEWQRTAFANLSTPEITGPWENLPIQDVKLSSNAPSLSWIERVKAFVGAYPSWAFAVAAFGMLAIVVWLGFLNLRGTPTENEARQPKNTEKPGISAAPGNLEPSPEIADAKSLQKKEIKVADTEKISQKHQFRPEPITVAANVRAHQPHSNSMDLNSKRSLLAVRKAPNLSGIEDDEDTTVRLSDLFAEVGAGN